MEGEAIILFFIVGVFLVGMGMLASYLLAPTSKNVQKAEPYECGVETIGKTWIQYKVGYYLFALLFLIFDVEIIFIYPWAVVYREVGMVAFVEILIFFVILGLGLLYAWKKGALRWV
ncbi:NADH-quinone oxidoreductase subunit A [Candidatus Amoebophilus asiaticus]|nr:NADH-quinone oxidoreductase subunit A [Candidatus Amoebophilus asiaticus]